MPTKHPHQASNTKEWQINVTLNRHWDEEVDVLVLGGGCGGMSTALACSILGMSVLLCEKTDQVGGTTSTSAGTIWIP
ncbi:MAG: FAD-dependent oxidoreductase, partial [Betaproteobacteria bacterium]|nr:FAD-dependent oxidoreductase [Betaproteobacteria bacterium]